MDEYIEIPLFVEEIDVDVGLRAEDAEETVSLEAENAEEVVTNDYQILKNKPSINGTELFDNYDEVDPTVPRWAKGEEPEAMTMAEIYELWQSVFS